MILLLSELTYFRGFLSTGRLALKKIDEKVLNFTEEFFKGKPGKFALQIHPSLLNNEKTELLEVKGIFICKLMGYILTEIRALLNREEQILRSEK